MAPASSTPRPSKRLNPPAPDQEPLLRPASLVALAETMRTGRSSVTQHVAQVYERMRRVDRRIRAFLPESRRWSRLHAEALAVEDRWPDPTTRPPLFGIPIGIKDLFRVDGLPARAGSRLPAHLFAGSQASVVSMLRSAGAVIAGKTAMDEFAYCEPPSTRNPHNLAHTPGGSSNGSAAAVAAGVCPLALGTQTSRSVIGPAAFCGVVGFKPSHGRVPIDGVVPLAPSFDTVGLFTQDVPGALLAASVLVPGWRTLTPQHPPILGVPDGLFMTWTLEEGRRAFQVHIARLARAGYEVRHVQFFTDTELLAVDRQATDLLHGEMARVHSDWFEHYQARYRPRTARAIRRGQTVPDDELAACRTGRLLFRDQVAALMQQAGVDLWVTPASAGPAPEGFDQTGWGGMTTVWSYAGMPCVTVPAGLSTNHLPLGLQCVARFGDDELLLSWAKDIADARRPSRGLGRRPSASGDTGPPADG